MEDRTGQVAPAERPPEPTRADSDQPSEPSDPARLADPRALMILTTEHWSLLTSRSLVYNEAFARGGMFLTFLTGTLVALGFVSQGSGFGTEFLMVATVLLAFVLVIGFTTIGRLAAASDEEFRAIQGMNRMRHAYLEMVPSLEPYFSTSQYDDTWSVLAAYGSPEESESAVGNLLHGVTTMPGMIALITALIGGALAVSVALLLGASAVLSILAGIAVAIASTVAIAALGLRSFVRTAARIDVRFPRPPSPPGG